MLNTLMENKKVFNPFPDLKKISSFYIIAFNTMKLLVVLSIKITLYSN